MTFHILEIFILPVQHYKFVLDNIFTIKLIYHPFFMENKGFNVTQGMALLLLKPLNLPANYVLNLIIHITNPKNNIGY